MSFTLRIISITFILIFTFSCKPTNQTPEEDKTSVMEEETNSKPVLDPNYMISKDTFDVWKKRWDNNYRAYMAADSLHYFSMPLFDMNAIIGENGTGSRLYMGMAIDAVSGKKLPHVMLVGETNGVVNWTRIMDYTNSCPPICGN